MNRLTTITLSALLLVPLDSANLDARIGACHQGPDHRNGFEPTKTGRNRFR